MQKIIYVNEGKPHILKAEEGVGLQVVFGVVTSEKYYDS